MRTKLLGLLVFAPWLFLVVCEPLIQPLYQAQLTNDQDRSQVPAAGVWWVTDVLSADDSKATTALCGTQSANAGCELSQDAGCSRPATQPGAVPRAVNIRELLCVYLI